MKNKFVRLYLPNTWTVRTRTADDGLFRLLLGATAERKGKAQVVKLGDRVMPKDSKAGEYALFMMPENYKPCAPQRSRARRSRGGPQALACQVSARRSGEPQVSRLPAA